MENLGLFRTDLLDSMNTNEFQFFAHGFRKNLKPWYNKDAVTKLGLISLNRSNVFISQMVTGL